MNHTSEFVRITEIVSLIRGYEPESEYESNDLTDDALTGESDDAPNAEGITIREIAHRLGNTLAQTREDVAALASIGVKFDSGCEIGGLTAKTDRFDDEPLYMDPLFPDEPLSSCYLFLSPTQRALYEKHSLKRIEIKDSPVSVSAKELERKDTIRKAIRNKQWIRFRYRRAGTVRSETVETFPRLLYHNLTNERLYCITLGEDGSVIPYRLDRISFDVRIIKGRAVPDADLSNLALFDCIWGADFAPDEKPVHVKVRIRENTGNILAKFRADTAGRTYGTLKKAGSDGSCNIWIYEDEVIGTHAFRSWLRSFGSAVKVLEPPYIADAMLATAVRSRLNYRAGRFVSDEEYETLRGSSITDMP